MVKKLSIFFPLWLKIMANVDENTNLYRLCRRMNVQYHHELFKYLAEIGWMELMTYNGREKRIKLTKKGFKMHILARQIYYHERWSDCQK
jgi:predicted transcriptional regulator